MSDSDKATTSENACMAAPTDKWPWKVNMICCGNDAGLEEFATWEDADKFRNDYVATGPGGWGEHDRSAIVSGPDHRVHEPAKPRVMVGVGMPAALHLDAFAREVMDAFGERPYLVGTAAVGKEWRDVDVRLMLPDEQFDHLFPGHTKPDRGNAMWSLLCAALAELASQRAGLPVDFQIQRMSDANNRYKGPRIPLGMYVAGGR